MILSTKTTRVAAKPNEFHIPPGLPWKVLVHSWFNAKIQGHEPKALFIETAFAGAPNIPSIKLLTDIQTGRIIQTAPQWDPPLDHEAFAQARRWAVENLVDQYLRNIITGPLTWSVPPDLNPRSNLGLTHPGIQKDFLALKRNFQQSIQ
jgi:hypothetical protein